MKQIFIFLFLFIALSSTARASNGGALSLNSVFADKSLANIVSLQPTMKDVAHTFDLDFSLDAGKFRNQVNYNSALDDFTIEKTLLFGGLDLTWNKLLTVGVAGSTENVNQGEVRINGVSSKIRIRAFDFTLKAALTDRYVRQISDFIVLNTNIKDRLTLRNTKKSVSLSYYGFDTFSFSLAYSNYVYDTDVAAMNTLLSAKAPLQKNGASFLSQIYSLIDHETTLDVVYSANEDMDLEFMVGNTEDFLDPHVKSNEYRLGGTYYFKIFSLSGGVTGVKADDTDEALYSGDLTITYEF